MDYLVKLCILLQDLPILQYAAIFCERKAELCKTNSKQFQYVLLKHSEKITEITNSFQKWLRPLARVLFCS